MYNESGKTKIIAVDTGMKNNQIRCLMRCQAQIKVVPWDYDFVPELVSKGTCDSISAHHVSSSSLQWCYQVLMILLKFSLRL